MRLYERFADKDFHTSIATSFGIDFDAYETIVLPRLRGAGCRNNMVIADARMLTHALAGPSPLPRHAGKLYTVSGAGAVGVFHPKLFLQVGRRRGRIVVSSANLTAPGLAGNLELAGMIACDDAASGEQQLIAQAWTYASRFVGDGSQQSLSNQLDWMHARAHWLSRATPADGPVRIADDTYAALLVANETRGIGQRFAELVNEQVSRLMIISPDWDPNLAALSFLINRFAAEEICILLDPKTASFPKQALGGIQADVQLYARGDFRKGRFIHAKAIIAQTANADHVLLGSANCTSAALGLASIAGSNEEVCLYRRLPAGSTSEALDLSAVFGTEQRIDPEALPDLCFDEELALDELTTQSPGRFECRGDTLIWKPSHVFAPPACTIVLLDQQGKPIPCSLSPLSVEADTVRFQIDGAQERPAFARVRHRDGKLSAPSIVTLIDRLRAAIRETSSRQADNALRQLDDETEASLLLLDVLGVLEQIERGDAAKEPISIPKVGTNKAEAEADYRKLSYEQFIAGRRLRRGSKTSHNSLAGSDVTIVRNFLNRIVGLSAAEKEETEDEGNVIGDAFNMGDETADAEGALAAGEEFDTAKTQREEDEHAKAERRRTAKKEATKAQIVTAVVNFRERIRVRKESGALDNHDIIRLRALLMIICTAAYREPAGNRVAARAGVRVLPVEGEQDSWPLVLGRILFDIFGGNHPAIMHLYLTSEHDQIPDDIVECWATCYWCLQACLMAPLSAREQKRVTQYLRPLAAIAYRLTLPSREELLGSAVTGIMDAMSTSYGERLGISPSGINKGHRHLVELVLKSKSN